MTWRWGVAGPGHIAERFADAIAHTDGEIGAVASRTPGRAADFAARYGVARHHDAYEALAADPEVDVVYVATRPSTHLADTLLFVEAGKHVLCEKPFALDEAEGRVMVEAARRHGVFLMEALWSRFLPGWQAIGEAVADGRIGEVRLVEASLGFPFPADSRLFDRATGGGALLDLGVYPINLAAVLLGAPEEVLAAGTVGPSGVDEHSVVLQRFAGGALAVATSAATEGLACTARITGTAGVIDVPAMFHCPASFTVAGAGGIEQVPCGFEGDGIRFELDEVHRCLDEGRTESPVLPLDETLRILGLLDGVRATLGVSYG